MFDNERPERISTAIWVPTYDRERSVCARCCSQVSQRDVAAYTRTKPGDSFDPWCARCFSTLARWALAGAGHGLAEEQDPEDSEFIGIIFDGSN